MNYTENAADWKYRIKSLFSIVKLIELKYLKQAL